MSSKEKQADRIEKQADRISAIIKMVRRLGPGYSTLNSTEKIHFETTIGASLWYVRGKYTGRCSKQLLLKQKNEKKWNTKNVSYEHPWPRKIMAKKLLLNYESPALELIVKKLKHT